MAEGKGFCVYSTVGPLINKLCEKIKFGSMIIHVHKLKMLVSFHQPVWLKKNRLNLTI